MKAPLEFCLVVVLATLVGCDYLTPKTYQLEHIHATYTSEWAQSQLPDAASRPTPGSGSSGFKNTLAEIRNYKITHGGDTRVAAHLAVLEGMIHLQAGKPGLASLLKKDVAAALPQLESSAGVATRDYVFAKCFPDLVEGWSAVLKISATHKPPAITSFIGPADRLVAILRGIDAANRAAAEVDSGGAYIATSAAIFYLWSSSVSSGTHPKKTMAKKGVDALRPWLTKGEIKSAEVGGADIEGMVSANRARYVAWYRWLFKAAG